MDAKKMMEYLNWYCIEYADRSCYVCAVTLEISKCGDLIFYDETSLAPILVMSRDDGWLRVIRGTVEDGNFIADWRINLPAKLPVSTKSTREAAKE